MTESDWEQRIVGVRMTVDQRFADRVQASQFSRQQWGLIMTAVEFEIADADDPDRARIVADTAKLPQILPELDNVQQQMDAMAGGGGGGSSGGGLFSSVKEAFGLGGGGGEDAERRQAAEELTQEYAEELQALLVEQERWEEVRAVAAGE